MTHPMRTLALLGLLLLTVPAHASDQAAVKASVERGVVYLKKLQTENGTWPRNEMGATSLAALTLLECDVPANDPVIQKAATAIRKSSIRETHTYSLTLALLFLDRLGEPNDAPLIESLAVRLLAGQNRSGGWGYRCPATPESEVRRLEALLDQPRRTPPEKEPADGKRERRPLPREIQEQLALIARSPPPTDDTLGDNSNTQFGAMALWIARRYSIPTEPAAVRLDTRFRGTQSPVGGWGYHHTPRGQGDPQATPSMTCAGLLGLAVGHGIVNEASRGRLVPDISKDISIRAGLAALGTAIDHPSSKKPGNPPVPVVSRSGGFYYFIWSLERVAMVFSLETIGGKDWHLWGSEILLASQKPDGSWVGEYAQGGADTCFALLFLVRANLARDLTASLRGRIQDPGEVVLRAGGVDGSSLQPGRLKPALDPKENTPAKPVPEPKDKPLTPVVPAVDAETARLAARLVEAKGERQDEALALLRDSKGVEYTQALAAAIPQLNGTVKSKARDALAERLTRMSSATLRDKLEDDDPEVRRAAALACAMKDDKAHLRKLIDLLEDREESVVRAARAALKSLSNQDFGPAAGATPADRARAVAAWKNWWSKQSGK